MKKLLVFIFSLLTSATFFSNAGVLEDCLLTRPPLPPEYYPPFVTGQGPIIPPASQGCPVESISFKDLYSSDVLIGYVSITNEVLEIQLSREMSVSSVTAVNRSTGKTYSIYLQDNNIILIPLSSSQNGGWWDITITTMGGRVYSGDFYSLGKTGPFLDPGFQEVQPKQVCAEGDQ